MRRKVVRKGRVERIAADDLMEMGRGDEGWVDERVDAVDDELGALES